MTQRDDYYRSLGYDAPQRPINANYITLTDNPPDPRCRVYERPQDVLFDGMSGPRRPRITGSSGFNAVLVLLVVAVIVLGIVVALAPLAWE